jgi:hypothetical protein
MAAYVSLVVLVLGFVTLVWGNYSDRQRRVTHFWVGVTFVALAVFVMIVSAIRSLWLYPLS